MINNDDRMIVMHKLTIKIISRTDFGIMSSKIYWNWNKNTILYAQLELTALNTYNCLKINFCCENYDNGGNRQ